LAFAPADWRKFYADRGWEPVELEEMSQTARQMNRHDEGLPHHRLGISRLGSKTAQDLGIGRRVA
jgi:hypothetical protein